MARKGITVYTLFIIVVLAISIFFIFLLLTRFSKKIPKGKEREFCLAKQRAYCLEWYSKGFDVDNKPEGYDFSECSKYGIGEPSKKTCEEII